MSDCIDVCDQWIIPTVRDLGFELSDDDDHDDIFDALETCTLVRNDGKGKFFAVSSEDLEYPRPEEHPTTKTVLWTIDLVSHAPDTEFELHPTVHLKHEDCTAQLYCHPAEGWQLVEYSIGDDHYYPGSWGGTGEFEDYFGLGASWDDSQLTKIEDMYHSVGYRGATVLVSGKTLALHQPVTEEREQA